MAMQLDNPDVNFLRDLGWKLDLSRTRPDTETDTTHVWQSPYDGHWFTTDGAFEVEASLDRDERWKSARGIIGEWIKEDRKL